MRSRFERLDFAVWLRAGGEPAAPFSAEVFWAQATLTPANDPTEANAAVLRKFLLVEAIGL